jgi:hypothetical protein
MKGYKIPMVSELERSVCVIRYIDNSSEVRIELVSDLINTEATDTFPFFCLVKIREELEKKSKVVMQCKQIECLSFRNVCNRIDGI